MGRREVKEWDEFKVFIETCGTDEDAGFKGLLSGEPWSRAMIFAPDGRLIYRLRPRLADVGSGTVFLESAEPPFEGFPLDKFLDQFPEGEYTAWGRTPSLLRCGRHQRSLFEEFGRRDMGVFRTLLSASLEP